MEWKQQLFFWFDRGPTRKSLYLIWLRRGNSWLMFLTFDVSNFTRLIHFRISILIAFVFPFFSKWFDRKKPFTGGTRGKKGGAGHHRLLSEISELFIWHLEHIWCCYGCLTIVVFGRAQGLSEANILLLDIWKLHFRSPSRHLRTTVLVFETSHTSCWSESATSVMIFEASLAY